MRTRAWQRLKAAPNECLSLTPPQTPATLPDKLKAFGAVKHGEEGREGRERRRMERWGNKGGDRIGRGDTGRIRN